MAERNKKHPENTLLKKNGPLHRAETANHTRGAKFNNNPNPCDPMVEIRHKANPGILGWLVDPKKGLFSPLATLLPDAIKAVIIAPTPDLIEKTIKAQVDKILAALGTAFPAKSPKTPDEAQAEANLAAVNTNLWLFLLQNQMVGLEAASLGMIDMMLEGYIHLPGIESARQIAIKTWTIEFESAIVPLLQRHFLKKHRPFVPPIQDLRLMAVREAFPVEPGLPQYKEMEKWALEHGMDPFWTERYLYMGFERMDVRDAMKFFLWYHDEKAGYEDWLRIADIHPDDRPRVSEVSYTVPSLRELGYGYDVGRYSRDDIRDARRRGGLSPTDAEKAADSMIAYRTEAEREAVRREHMHLYALGKETIAQFEAHIRRLGTAPAAVPLWLERAELEKARRISEPAMPEQRTVSASEALTALEMGIRHEEWTRAKLADLYWTPERIDLAIERVKWQDRAGDEIRKRRGVLEDMLKEGFLKKAAFSTELKAMNFTPTVIAALEEWAEQASDWDDLKEQAAEWWRLAKARKITPETYAKEVRALGMVEERITSKMKLLRKLAEIAATEAAAK